MRIKNSIAENCNVEVDEDKYRKVLDGVHGTFKYVVEHCPDIISALPKINENITAIFGSASIDVGFSQLQSMLEFVNKSINVVVKAYSVRPFLTVPVKKSVHDNGDSSSGSFTGNSPPGPKMRM